MTGADLSINIYKRTLYQEYPVHVMRNSSEVINGIIVKTNAAIGVINFSLIMMSSFFIIIGIVVLVIAGVVGAILFMRKGGDNMITKDTPDEFTQQLMPGQFKAFQPTHTEAHVSAPQQVVAQVAAVATVAEPAVVQQWTDEKGNTWRSMDNGTTLWWNGTDWQQV